VTAPLFLLPAGALDAAAPGAVVRLDGEEGRHAASVRRIRAGEPVDVADGTGRTARCTVTHAGPGGLALTVERVDVARPPGLRLVLVQALAKGGRDETAVETATELGVDAVVPWQATRSIVRWAAERGERSRQRWVATARSAAKQSRRPSVPDVGALVTTAGLVDLVAGTVAAGGAALVLHEEATEPLAGVPLPAAPGARGPAVELLVVVGPEGGIAPEELDALAAAGGRAVRLGREVLRTSSAGAAALAVLSVRIGRWTA
jgi:16S rRNA (uracil1498-N3)-methyltransferase